MTLADDEIVVLAQRGGQFEWYVSDRDYWVLDWETWLRAFVDAGYGAHDPNHASRFGMGVVDVHNSATFLDHMNQCRAPLDMLKTAQMADGQPAFPGLFVDFDARRIVVNGIESPPFEDFMPSGWSASFGAFESSVPTALRFWS